MDRRDQLARANSRPAPLPTFPSARNIKLRRDPTAVEIEEPEETPLPTPTVRRTRRPTSAHSPGHPDSKDERRPQRATACDAQSCVADADCRDRRPTDATHQLATPQPTPTRTRTATASRTAATPNAGLRTTTPTADRTAPQPARDPTDGPARHAPSRRRAIRCIGVPAIKQLPIQQGDTYASFNQRDDEKIWQANTERFIQEGKEVFHDANKLGSTIGISCDMCHPDAANTHPETYPKYQVQLQRVALLRDMIEWCIENPVKGKAMDPNDPRLRAMEAYILSQRKGVPLEYGGTEESAAPDCAAPSA